MLAVTLIQTSLVWENPEANINNLSKLIAPIQQSDVLVLPEMFTTGFTMKPQQLAEPANGMGLQWMRQQALEKNAALVGSLCVSEQKKYYNRLYWVEPHTVFQYEKRHLFRMGEEHQHYTAGTKKIIIQKKGWNILPLVCYDLRFPAWSRNQWHIQNDTLQAQYDVLLYVANWPEVRSYAFKQLLIARAIENQCYVVAVNRIGMDGNGISHSGDSMIINPLGSLISNTKAHEEKTETVMLDMEFLTDCRKKFPVGLDADEIQIKE
ncbi:MAG: amidohydrolase [Bacteroidetes bacterium]|nr:amidohydrolase [Bacteroidota bacterium]